MTVVRHLALLVILLAAAVGTTTAQGTPKQGITKEKSSLKTDKAKQADQSHETAEKVPPTADKPCANLSDTHTARSSQDIETQRKLVDFTMLLAIVGGLQFLALIVQAIVFWRTLNQVKAQANLMRVHAEHLENLVAAAKANAEAARDNAIAAKESASALINSERAWIVAELVPICVRFGGDWHRPVGNGWAQLSEKEIFNGDHVKHKLKFTNMGRTPAHILRYQISYSCLDKGVTSLSGGTVARQDSGRIFDHLLSATDSIEVPETVDVNKYMFNRIKGIKDLENTAVFHGWVEYLHVFSDSEVVNVPFCYIYKPSTLGLERVPEIKVHKGTEDDKSKNQSPN
jgi:hypothetical protein